MGDLANMVSAVAMNTASATQLNEARRALNAVQDLAGSLAPLVANVESEARLVVALGVQSAAVAAKATDAKVACASLLSAIKAPDIGGVPKAAEVDAVKDKLSQLVPEMRAASRAAWILYRDQHITDGARSVLEAANGVGVKGAEIVGLRFAEARNWNQIPSVDAFNNLRSAVVQYDQIRAELADGDDELENFVVQLTGAGVSLSALQSYPDGQKWLEKYDLADRLRVVMRKD